MIDLIAQYNIGGLTIAVITFFLIGLFHPIVIKSEYYFGVRCWWVFALLGSIFLILTITVKELFFSSILGVLSCSCFWSILEIFEQRERVRKGWFPENPKKKNRGKGKNEKNKEQ